MIETKAAFIISMFDEYSMVIKTLVNINCMYKNPTIIVIRSDDGENKKEWKLIQALATKTAVLPNLAKKYDRVILPAYAVTRNFSKGFSLIDEKADYIVALLGDTYISNPKPLHKKAEEMIKSNKFLCCCKAYGQYFHDSNSTVKKLQTSRFQGDDTTDFSAVLFVVNGKFFKKTNCFTKIDVTNKFCSEQCLGDEMLKHMSTNKFLSKTLLLNAKNPTFCYSFTDGITYHAITGKPGR